MALKADHLQGYLNLKGYREFEAEHRASGWNAWLNIRNLTRPAERDATKGTAHDTKMICDDSRTVRLSLRVYEFTP